MFTGLIEEIGTVKNIEPSGNGINLSITADAVLQDTKIGDSISIEGACQTVTGLGRDYFTVFASKVTCEVTTLGGFSIGKKVNLERAMSASSRFGGHIVQGHVDGKGEIQSVVNEEKAVRIEISAGSPIMNYIVERGSVAVDGISFTVVSASDRNFIIYIIPETIKKTTIAVKKKGDAVNIEVDILAKYVEKMLNNNKNNSEEREKNLKRVLIEGGYI